MFGAIEWVAATTGRSRGYSCFPDAIAASYNWVLVCAEAMTNAPTICRPGHRAKSQTRKSRHRI